MSIEAQGLESAHALEPRKRTRGATEARAAMMDPCVAALCAAPASAPSRALRTRGTHTRDAS